MFVNNAGGISQCWKQIISDNNAKKNRMYGGIAQILNEQKETVKKISKRLIGRVTFSAVRSVNSKVLILLNFCFKLKLTAAGGIYS